jgi:hypothetical protein
VGYCKESEPVVVEWQIKDWDKGGLNKQDVDLQLRFNGDW